MFADGSFLNGKYIAVVGEVAKGMDAGPDKLHKGEPPSNPDKIGARSGRSRRSNNQTRPDWPSSLRPGALSARCLL